MFEVRSVSRLNKSTQFADLNIYILSDPENEKRSFTSLTDSEY